MTPALEPLRGQAIRGVIGYSPRSLALGFGSRPRAYLWIHLERKEAWAALADQMPIVPDPRGSRFASLEDSLRGLEVVEATAAPGALRVRLARAGEPTHDLSLVAESTRVNLVLRALEGGSVLWAFRRDAERTEGSDAPAAFRPPVVHVVDDPSEREALRGRIDEAFRDDFQRELERALKAAERTLARRLEAQRGDLERARSQQAARRWGEILLSHYHEIPRGAGRVRLPDTFADPPGVTVEIPLDPALSPHENAARLFQLAKKGERGEKLVETRLARTRNNLAALERLRRELSTAAPKESLRLLGDFLRASDLISSARGDPRSIRLGRQTADAPRAGRPVRRPPGARKSIGPRTLFTSDGWEVWVGRNNTDNDRITHRLSNPHDYWLHVVGVPGSHVILRRPTRTAVPRPRTLEEAAAIAAYFSKARKLTRVPVIYTERKFVSKPRRGKPGQAICTRERELLVRPRIPETNAGDDIEREVSS